MSNNYDSASISPFRALKVLKDLCVHQNTATIDTASSSQQAANICTDSRLVRLGDIYIAYRGVKTDGHSFLEAVCQQQPSLLIIEDEKLLPKNCSTNWIKVTSARLAWSYLCYAAFDCQKQPLIHIGITGTNGKTSTTWIVRELLRNLGESTLLVGTLGIEYADQNIETKHTTPDPPVFYQHYRKAALAGVRYCIMEVSSHAIQQEKLAPLQFDYTAFTSFSRDHLDLHGSMEAYFDTKQNFIEAQSQKNARTFIHESVVTNELFQNHHFKKYESYGCTDQNQYKLDPTYLQQGLTQLKIEFQNNAVTLDIPLSGEFLIDNFAVAFAIVNAIKPQTLNQKIVDQIHGVPGRLEYVSQQNSTKAHIYVDYAHTPDALEKALQALKKLMPKQLWLIFGCGGNRDQGKRPLMGTIAEKFADKIILTNDNPRHEDPTTIINDIAKGLSQSATPKIVVDRGEAIEYAIQNAHKNDIILIAGKGHEDYMEIGDQRIHFDDRETARAILEGTKSQ